MATPTVTVEFYNGSTWVDISADVQVGTLKWNGGIPGGDATDHVADPGGMECELDNSQANSGAKLGYYSPDNANLRTGWVIGAPIRIKIVYGGNTRYWRYKVTDIAPAPGQYKSRRVKVLGADYMEEFSIRNVSGLAIQTNKRGDELLTTLVASMPVAPVATSYDTGAFILPYSFHDEQDEATACLSVAQKISQSDFSYIFVDGDSTGGETLHYQSHKTRQATTTSAATFTNTMVELILSHNRDMIWNKIKVTTSPVDIDTVLSVLGRIPEEFAIEPGETKTIYLRYIDEDTSRRISGTGLITPAADTDYKMSSRSGNAGNDLNASLSIAPVAGANTLLAVVENTGAAKGYVNLLQVRGYKVTLYDKVESVQSDSASMLAYGERTLVYNMPYQNSSAVGNAFAEELLRRYKSPTSNIEGMSFFANRSDTFMGYALTKGIGNRITITETVTGVNTDFFINGYKYELQKGNVLKVEWNFERNFNSTSYWILGDAVYGVLGSTTTIAPL